MPRLFDVELAPHLRLTQSLYEIAASESHFNIQMKSRFDANGQITEVVSALPIDAFLQRGERDKNAFCFAFLLRGESTVCTHTNKYVKVAAKIFQIILHRVRILLRCGSMSRLYKKFSPLLIIPAKSQPTFRRPFSPPTASFYAAARFVFARV